MKSLKQICNNFLAKTYGKHLNHEEKAVLITMVLLSKLDPVLHLTGELVEAFSGVERERLPAIAKALRRKGVPFAVIQCH